MANPLAPAATPPAPAVDEAQARLREELAYERGARQAAESALARPVVTGPPPPPKEDAFERLGADSLSLKPEEQAGLIRRGTQQTVRGMVGPELQRLRREFRSEAESLQFQAAMDAALSANPDIAQDQEKFAAAAAAAEFDIKRSGRGVSPGEYVRRSVQKFRQMFTPQGSAAPPPDYVEGSTAPSLGAPLAPPKPPVEAKKESNPFSRWYGEDGDTVEVFDENTEGVMKKMTSDYADEKNGYLDERGTRSFIPRVVGPLRKRRKAAAAAAAAAGK
jgi:hypothetical protein